MYIATANKINGKEVAVMANSNLQSAKKAKNDEFYTQWAESYERV